MRPLITETLGSQSSFAISDILPCWVFSCRIKGLLAGFEPGLISALENQILASVSLYIRDYSVKVDYDQNTQSWTKNLIDDGDASLLIKTSNGDFILAEITEARGGLYWERSNRRVQVEPFSVLQTIQGPIDGSVVVEYLEIAKFRMYSTETAIPPSCFATDCMCFISQKGFKVLDLKNELIDAHLAKNGKQIPPIIKAPLEIGPEKSVKG